MFTDPIKNLRAFGLREDSIVADLGAGTGHYSLAASILVPFGKVYAVEIAKDFLTTIKNRATEAKCSNLECLWGDVEKIGGTNLGDNIVDAVIASNILFQVSLYLDYYILPLLSNPFYFHSYNQSIDVSQCGVFSFQLLEN